MIFICDFDPFDKGQAIYKFENYCVAEKIFLLYSSYIKRQQNAILLKEEGRKVEPIRQLSKKRLIVAKIIDLFDLSDDEAKLYFGDIQTT